MNFGYTFYNSSIYCLYSVSQKRVSNFFCN